MATQFDYLVFLCHDMDDIPLRLFQDRDEAFDFAKAAKWFPPDAMSKALELPDISTPNCIKLLTFRDGEPVSYIVVKTFDDDSDSDGANAPTPEPALHV